MKYRTIDLCGHQIRLTDDWWPKCKQENGHEGNHSLRTYGEAAILDEWSESVAVDPDDTHTVVIAWWPEVLP